MSRFWGGVGVMVCQTRTQWNLMNEKVIAYYSWPRGGLWATERDGKKTHLTLSNIKMKCAEPARITQGSKCLRGSASSLTGHTHTPHRLLSSHHPETCRATTINLLTFFYRRPYWSSTHRYKRLWQLSLDKDFWNTLACLSLKTFILGKYLLSKGDHLKSWEGWDFTIYLIKLRQKWTDICISKELKIRSYPEVSWIDPAVIPWSSFPLLPQHHGFCANCSPWMPL